MSEPSFAEMLFEIDQKHDKIESELFDHTLKILCLWDAWQADPRTANVPFEDITHDWYDSSFELKDCAPGFDLSLEQRRQFWNLGFDRCWLCYRAGGEEKHYYKNGDAVAS